MFKTFLNQYMTKFLLITTFQNLQVAWNIFLSKIHVQFYAQIEGHLNQIWHY